MVVALSLALLHGRSLPITDYRAEAVVSVHRQPHLQFGALLHHPHRLPRLRRGKGAKCRLLRGHWHGDTERRTTDD